MMNILERENHIRDGNEEEERYSCPETGSHFEFLDMCRRLKRLQTRRVRVDKVIEEEEKRKSTYSRELHVSSSQPSQHERGSVANNSELLKKQRATELREMANLLQMKNNLENKINN